MRLWPRSLLGQVLLGVALALLVAQALSAFLLYRAGEERREASALDAVAYRLVADDMRGPEFANEQRGRRGIRIRLLDTLPAPVLALRDNLREQQLRAVLAAQGVTPRDVVVAELDRASLRSLRAFDVRGDGPRFRRDGAGPAAGERRVLVAAIRSGPGAEWHVAALPRRDRDPGAVRGIVLQTVIIYLVLVGLLALLLRRITRPLARLTRRVDRFGVTGEVRDPLEPEGPDDIANLIAAQTRMEERIIALLDEKDVMLGAIGHDLKTPLAALRVRIESVEDDAERAKMAATIEDLSNSLDDILSLARIGRPGQPPERADLFALVGAVVEEFEDMGQPVEMMDGRRLVAQVHVTWLRRALRNLVANAVRYGGEARVWVEQRGDDAVIGVSDNGSGIPEGRIAAMMEPFTRGEPSRNRATGGSGLGLTIARAIAQQHGGDLVLANRPEGGLLAEIRLPLRLSASSR